MGISKKEPLTAEHYRVYKAIGTGHANAVPLKDLSAKVDMRERKVRKCIEVLILHRMPICNRGDNRGYFRPESAEDIERELAKRISYRKAFYNTEYALKKAMDAFIYEQALHTTEGTKQEIS